MDISFFRSRIPGPEIVLEDVVTNNIEEFTPTDGLPSWIACSPRIGAGMPDVLFAYYNPEVYALTGREFSHTQLLAFLRAMRGAQLDSILIHLKYSEKNLRRYLEELINVNVIEQYDSNYYLTKTWLNIIPTIVTVEIKVQDWRRAVSQASRNKIFSNQSYVALPKAVSDRVKNDPTFVDHGIGLLSIENESVHKEIEAAQTQPQIWEYYYRLALLLANK